jgi:hypothetical protein
METEQMFLTKQKVADADGRVGFLVAQHKDRKSYIFVYYMDTFHYYIYHNGLQHLKPTNDYSNITYKRYYEFYMLEVSSEEISPRIYKVITEEENKMSKVKQMSTSIVRANKEAAKTALKLEVGRTGLNFLINHLKAAGVPKHLLDNPLGKVIVANVALTIQTGFAPNTKYAQLLTQAMLDTAMDEGLRNLNFAGIINEAINSVGIDKLKDLEGCYLEEIGKEEE